MPCLANHFNSFEGWTYKEPAYFKLFSFKSSFRGVDTKYDIEFSRFCGFGSSQAKVKEIRNIFFLLIFDVHLRPHFGQSST